ncbi:MAG: hypothetical protein LBQ24_00905 [Candidatus Peribacteria bacterium]|nr:hypothetical protein [Candidatus Peribacteria bacterium]
MALAHILHSHLQVNIVVLIPAKSKSEVVGHKAHIVFHTSKPVIHTLSSLNCAKVILVFTLSSSSFLILLVILSSSSPIHLI